MKNNNIDLLKQVAAGTLSAEAAAKLIGQQAKQGQKLSLKVSEKGAVSVYGLGRWPVTLYATQMRTLLGLAKEIEKFMTEHSAELSVKE